MRLAATLTRLASASDLHAHEVANAIERLIRFEAAEPPRASMRSSASCSTALGNGDRRQRPASDRLPLRPDRLGKAATHARHCSRFRGPRRGEQRARATPGGGRTRERWMTNSAPR